MSEYPEYTIFFRVLTLPFALHDFNQKKRMHLKTPPAFLYAMEYALVPDRLISERQVSSVSSVTSWLLLNCYDEISQKNVFGPGDLDL